MLKRFHSNNIRFSRIKNAWRMLTLCSILFVAFFLRLYELGEVPRGLHRDEAFLGYNAYSLLKTGMDMSGHSWPIHFESFLYSPGGYSYVTIPFIWLFDLSAFSVRLPAAFFGALSIAAVYFLVMELLFGKKEASVTALLTALFLAVSPWHLNLSRTATEHIVVLFLFLLGMLLFFRVRRRFHWIDYMSAFILWAATLTLYQSPRAFLPLFLPFLFVLFPLKKAKSMIWSFVLFAAFIVVPVTLILTSPNLATRMRTVSVFSTEQTTLTIEEQLREDGVMGISPLQARLMHNKLVGYADTILTNFLSHLSYEFLFTDKGLPARYKVPYEGLLPLIMLPLLMVGFYALARSDKRLLSMIVIWIGVGIFGSALTFDDVPNVQRTVIIVPALLMVVAYGLSWLLRQQVIDKRFPVWIAENYPLPVQKMLVGKLTNRRLKLGIMILFTVCFVFELSHYLHHYYVQQLVHRPWSRHEGYEEMVSVVNGKLASGFEKAVVTNRESAPAIFFLFFSKYDPARYIAEIKNSPLRDFDRVNFGPYQFVEDDCLTEKESTRSAGLNGPTYDCVGEKNTIYVNSLICDAPVQCGNVVREIKRGDGTRIFSVVEP